VGVALSGIADSSSLHPTMMVVKINASVLDVLAFNCVSIDYPF